MRYWGYLAFKLLALGFALHYVWAGCRLALPAPELSFEGRAFGYDLFWTLTAGFFFLLCCGAVFLAILDQRYRCRVCLRRLRMPIPAGSWSRMLQLGRPSIEYICPFGHGTLRVSEVQIWGLEVPDWKRHDDDIWKELAAASGAGE